VISADGDKAEKEMPGAVDRPGTNSTGCQLIDDLIATGQAISKSFWLCADLHRSTQANDHVLRPITGSRFFPICPELP
jgi:hypothetical protein